jgi:hypothetical protein
VRLCSSAWRRLTYLRADLEDHGADLRRSIVVNAIDKGALISSIRSFTALPCVRCRCSPRPGPNDPRLGAYRIRAE